MYSIRSPTSAAFITRLNMALLSFAAFSIGVILVQVFHIQAHFQTPCTSLNCENEQRLLLTLSRMQLNTISALRERYDASQQRLSLESNSLSSYNRPLATNIENECDLQYGVNLAINWRDSAQNWCSESATGSSHHNSKLTCFPYQQSRRSQVDTFCVAENFVVDFFANSSSSNEPHRSPLSASCAKTAHFDAAKLSSSQLQMVRMPDKIYNCSSNLNIFCLF